MTARLLFVLLCGNLDLDPDLNSNDTQLVFSKDEGDSDLWPNYKQFPLSGPLNTDSAWMHIEYIIYPLRTYRDMADLTPRQWPMHDINCKNSNCENPGYLELPLARTIEMVRLIRQTKTQVDIQIAAHGKLTNRNQLRIMLACQLPVGATVGAPVVFYLGTFVYTIIVTLVNLGDNDTSIDIAFGM
jgi:hypothetical protein